MCSLFCLFICCHFLHSVLFCCMYDTSMFLISANCFFSIFFYFIPTIDFVLILLLCGYFCFVLFCLIQYFALKLEKKIHFLWCHCICLCYKKRKNVVFVFACSDCGIVVVAVCMFLYVCIVKYACVQSGYLIFSYFVLKFLRFPSSSSLCSFY